MPSASPISIALPDGLDGQAWASATTVIDAAGDPVSTEVAMGRLGRSATTTLSIPRSDGYARVVPAGGFVLVFVQGESATRIEVYRDGRHASTIDPGGWVDDGLVAVDPERELLYAGVKPAGGGVDVRRFALGGSANASLFTLDDRFAEDGIPTNHVDLVVASDGNLVAEACADAECRLWRVPPGEAAGRPVRLAAGTPGLCSLVAATDAWLVASDEDLCSVDTGEAPFPWRVISLSDGHSRLITDESQVAIGRVLAIDGHPVAVAGHRTPDWSKTSVETYRLPRGPADVVVAGLANAPDDAAWLGVSGQVMPGSWVLIEPWGVETTVASPLTARLLDVATGRQIELPLGTAGWR
jgi:hypothetical protein